MKLSPRGSRIPVMVGGWEGELPSIASGEREEGEGDRDGTSMVVICGEREDEKCDICHYDNHTELEFVYLHSASVQL